MPTVNISPVAGAAWQFFDNNGAILSGGLLYTYVAGGTTPATTYTTSAGSVANANPIVLDSAGRTPNEVWLAVSTTYKFVLKTSTGTTIGTYDSLVDAAAQTQAALVAYEASVAASTGSSLVGYLSSSANATASTVQARLRTGPITPKDFGAVMDGTTDDATAWTAFAAALAVSPRPYGYIPAGTLLTSSTPNFAIQNLTLECASNARIKSSASGANSCGFKIDGSSNTGGNATGVYGITMIGRLTVQADGADYGAFIKLCHHGDLSLDVTGALTAGHYHYGNVCTTFNRCTMSANEVALTHTPTNLLYVTGGSSTQNSYCTYINPAMEGGVVAVYFDYALGNVIVGGTIEGNSSKGLYMTANALQNKLHGTDFESNTTEDIECLGRSNHFIGVDTNTRINIGAGGGINRIIGGNHKSILLNASSYLNTVDKVAYNRTGSGGTLTDNGVVANNPNCIGWNTDLSAAAGFQLGVQARQTITVGASPYVYQNLTAQSQVVAIVGGTVTIVTVGRGSDFDIVFDKPTYPTAVWAGTSVVVPPFGKTSVYYSVAPTMFAYPF